MQGQGPGPRHQAPVTTPVRPWQEWTVSRWFGGRVHSESQSHFLGSFLRAALGGDVNPPRADSKEGIPCGIPIPVGVPLVKNQDFSGVPVVHSRNESH